MVEEASTKYCQHCGGKINAKAEICPECGLRVAEPQNVGQQEVRDRKNPGLAAIASFLIPGLGQIYNGQIGKGLLIIFVWSVAIVMVISAPLLGFGLAFLIWVLSIYDSYNQAEKYNRGEELAF